MYCNYYQHSKLQNCDNRNDPDLVQAFLKKWWVKSDFKAPNTFLAGMNYNIKIAREEKWLPSR
jgi:hypothetical protein